MPKQSHPRTGLALALGLSLATAAPAENLSDEASRLIGARATQALPGARVAVQLGQIDPRLRLAPCDKIEPQIPAGVPLMGRSRLMLACVQGPKRWRVSVPVDVQVWAPAQVAAEALPAGTVLGPQHLRAAEVDLAAATSPAVRAPEAALGRTLARPLTAGATLREADLRARQWFASGDTVRLVVEGSGWRITAHGQAVSPGIEGRNARVRLDSGRTVQGRPSGPGEMVM